MFRNDLEIPTVNSIPSEEQSGRKSLFERFRLFFCLLVVALSVWTLSAEYKTFDIRRDWTSIAAIFMFSFVGLYPWLDGEEKKGNLRGILYWILSIPLLVATIIFHAQQLVSAYRWLGPGLSVAAALILVVLGILFKD